MVETTQLDAFDMRGPDDYWTPPEGAQIAIAEGYPVLSEERLPDASDGQLAETYLDLLKTMTSRFSFGNPWAFRDKVGAELQARGYTHVCRNLAFAMVFGPTEVRTDNNEGYRFGSGDTRRLTGVARNREED